MSSTQQFDAVVKCVFDYLKGKHPIGAAIYTDLFPDLSGVISGDYMKSTLHWLEYSGYIFIVGEHGESKIWGVTEKGWKIQDFQLTQ